VYLIGLSPNTMAALLEEGDLGTEGAHSSNAL
jgi:hypothetical protein